MPTFAVGTGFDPVGLTEGHQIFVDALTRFAEQSGNPRLALIIDQFGVPLCVAVLGCDAVGRGTVAAASGSLRLLGRGR